MSRCRTAARPLVLCLRQALPVPASSIAIRSLSQTASRADNAPTNTDTTTTSAEAGAQAISEAISVPEAAAPSTNSTKSKDADRDSDPLTVLARYAERKMWKAGTPPIGSRRRRAAIGSTSNVPFEQMPYQCFQEARKILVADRMNKIAQIKDELEKIGRLEAKDGAEFAGGEAYKQKRLQSMRKHVERLKILSDINDPLVKRKFEDGQGDMNKPIYRYLAEKRWKSYQHRLIVQRISQHYIVPDMLPALEPVMDVQLLFGRRRYEAGEIIGSDITELPPKLRIQAFDRGARLVSIAVVDPDVPLADEDAFGKRCHYLAANIPIDHLTREIDLAQLPGQSDEASATSKEVIPWLPPFAQKGAPNHRLAIFVMQQPDGPLDAAKLETLSASTRDGFSIRGFRDKHGLNPVGFSMFRSTWDEHTEAVMARHGIPGADVEFRHKRVYSRKEHRKAKGWEAKRQGPKYKHLWKYTHRIATPKRKFVR